MRGTRQDRLMFRRNAKYADGYKYCPACMMFMKTPKTHCPVCGTTLRRRSRWRRK